MISSVIARLNTASANLASTLWAIAEHPHIDVGDRVSEYMLPLAIEATDRGQMQEITDWLMGLEAVEWVDVVYVHFENEDEPGSNAESAYSSPAIPQTGAGQRSLSSSINQQKDSNDER